MTVLTQALERLVQKSLTKYDRFCDRYDQQWRSPCETGAPFVFNSIEVVAWQPISKVRNNELGGLADELHSDLREYYESFWSGGIEASCSNGPVSLLQVWNQEDFKRLKENLVGHLLAKKVMKLPLTGFFACTAPESDYILSVDTDSGRVVLEKPGYRSERTIAENLTEFLLTLEPADPWLNPERAEIKDLWQQRRLPRGS